VGRLGHTESMTNRPGRSAAYFDRWYADMVRAPIKDDIQQRHLGLPQGMLSTSSLTGDAIAEVVSALNLAADDTLLDLACGRGGAEARRASRSENWKRPGLTPPRSMACSASTQFSSPIIRTPPTANCCGFWHPVGARCSPVGSPSTRATNGCPPGCGGSTWAKD